MRRMKSNSIERPPVFHCLGNGAWYYNYNIQEVERTDEDGKPFRSFDYDTVQVWGTPTPENVKKAVIAEHWDLTQEVNLQNGSERFRLGLSEDKSLQDKYVEYLKKVDEIKEMIDSDFKKHSAEIN